MTTVDRIMLYVSIAVPVGAGVGLLVERYLTRWERNQEQITVTIDVSKFEQVWRSLLKLRLRPEIAPALTVRMEQDRVGSRNRTAAGAWRSDMCAAWVHGDCPLPGSCDCGCHR
jgi:hypothetical protein